MRKKLTMIAIIPLLIGVFITSFISIFLCERYLVSEQREKLEIAVEGYSDNLEAYKEQSIDITVFKGDTRKESSIKGAVGTKASSKVIEEVLNNGNIYFDTKVDVNGTSYYGYYKPTKDGMIFAGCPSDIVNNSLNSIIKYVVAVTFLLLLVFGVTGYYLSLRIYNRINSVYNGIEDLKDGNLNCEYEESNVNDELGETVNSIIGLSNKLKEVVGGITNTVSDVDNFNTELSVIAETTLQSSNEISRAIDDIAQGATEQASTTQSVSENVHNMSEDIRTINDFMNKATDYTSDAVESSKMMHEKIEQLKISSNETSDDIDLVSKQIEETNDIIKSVQGIVEVIEEIASQTNLLALNASIEAARAGEAGKGFAVVANTIKELSNNTSNQVSQINKIIGDLIKGFTNCNNSIESIVDSNNKQRDELNEVSESFSNLNIKITDVNSCISDTIVMTDKVNTSCDDISRNMSILSGVVENSAASTQEVSASVEELNELMHTVESSIKDLESKVNNLSKDIEFFKL